MVETRYNLIETDFDPKQVAQYSLSVMLHPDRLSYFISQAQSVLVFRQYVLHAKGNEGQIHRILKTDTLLRSGFHKVRLGVHSPKLSLLPEALFEEATARPILSRLCALAPEDRVENHYLAPLQLRLVYALPETVLAALRIYFPQASLYQGSAGWLLACQALGRDGLFVYVGEQSLMLTAFKGGQLRLLNHYSYKTSRDCLYYVLAWYRELGFSPETDTLYLSGELLPEGDIYQTLFKYIRSLAFLPERGYYEFGLKLRESLGPSFFMDLFSLRLCES